MEVIGAAVSAGSVAALGFFLDVPGDAILIGSMIAAAFSLIQDDECSRN